MLIDGHAHLHACHELDAALDAARSGFDAVRPGAASALWLTEGRGERASERLRAMPPRRWRARERDAVTWELRRDDGARLTVVFGRQIATAEDLEVIVVGTAEEPRENRPLPATIEPWLERDVLVMLPWGFGKWTGTRGRIVEQAYDRYAEAGLRLADTATRTEWLPEPRQFDRSRADGRPVFVGSDPFPFPDRLRAIGSAGFVATGLAPDAGWPEMLATMRAARAPLERFGRPLGTGAFLALQARMQVRKRLGGR